MSKKSSIARLLSDFIKADSIIDGREIEALNRLSEFYNIYDKDKVEAQKLQFSQISFLEAYQLKHLLPLKIYSRTLLVSLRSHPKVQLFTSSPNIRYQGMILTKHYTL